MSYNSLTKVYYKNESSYEDEYKKRYNAPFVKRLDISIKQYNHNNSYIAFFNYTEEMALITERIYKSYEELLYLINTVPTVVLHQFSLLSILEEVKATNDIEGVHSTKKELKEIIDGVAPKSARFASVVNKYYSLLTDVDIKFDTNQDIRNFYDEFAYEEIIAMGSENELDGKVFRKEPVDIKSATGKILHRGILTEEKILETMNYALGILNDDKWPFLIRVALFHYLFAYIHPFYDGNGRTGRFITTYYLSKHFHKIAVLRLSVLIKRNRTKYYELFREADSELNRGDMTPFIIGFLKFLLMTFDDTISLLKRKKVQLEAYEEKIERLNLQDPLLAVIYYNLLQAALFYGQGISISELANITKKAKATVKSRIDLIPQEHIIISTSNRVKFYKLNLLMFKDVEKQF